MPLTSTFKTNSFSFCPFNPTQFITQAFIDNQSTSSFNICFKECLLLRCKWIMTDLAIVRVAVIVLFGGVALGLRLDLATVVTTIIATIFTLKAFQIDL